MATIEATQQPTVFARMGDAFVSAASWSKRQVVALGGVVKEFAIRVYEFAMPYLKSVGAFFARQYATVKDLVVQHKEVSMITGGVLVLIAILAAAYIWFPGKATPA